MACSTSASVSVRRTASPVTTSISAGARGRPAPARCGRARPRRRGAAPRRGAASPLGLADEHRELVAATTARPRGSPCRSRAGRRPRSSPAATAATGRGPGRARPAASSSPAAAARAAEPLVGRVGAGQQLLAAGQRRAVDAQRDEQRDPQRDGRRSPRARKQARPSSGSLHPSGTSAPAGAARSAGAARRRARPRCDGSSVRSRARISAGHRPASRVDSRHPGRPAVGLRPTYWAPCSNSTRPTPARPTRSVCNTGAGRDRQRARRVVRRRPDRQAAGLVGLLLLGLRGALGPAPAGGPAGEPGRDRRTPGPGRPALARLARRGQGAAVPATWRWRPGGCSAPRRWARSSRASSPASWSPSSATMMLSEIGVNVGPIIASAGILGIALGFGAQSLVSDFLSGVFMIFEDQYGVGDEIDLGEAVGTVEAVSLRVTRLRDVNGTVWYVRNGEITRVGNMSQNWARTVLDISRRLPRGPRPGPPRARGRRPRPVGGRGLQGRHHRGALGVGRPGARHRRRRGPGRAQDRPARAVGGRPRDAAADQGPLRPRGHRDPAPAADGVAPRRARQRRGVRRSESDSRVRPRAAPTRSAPA